VCHVCSLQPPLGAGTLNCTPFLLFSLVYLREHARNDVVSGQMGEMRCLLLGLLGARGEDYSKMCSTCDSLDTYTSNSIEALGSKRPSQPTIDERLVVESWSFRSGPNWPRIPNRLG